MTYFSKHYHAPGTAPGTLVPSTTADVSLSIQLLDYGPEQIEEHTLTHAGECTQFLERDSMTWIQVNGQVDPDTLRHLGQQFNLHDLALEDVLNSGQRPKLDLYENQLFMTMALPLYEQGQLRMEQVSLFMGEDYLIGFCALEHDIFEPVRKRMRPPNNRRFVTRRIDYLLYAIVDLVVDKGFPVLEAFGDELEVLEEQMLTRPGQQALEQLHGLKREFTLMRRALWAQREMIGTLLRTDESLINPDTLVYLRDCQDHSLQIIDMLESFRDMAGGMQEIYLSSVANRTNENMRVLTIIATVFIPLTFIAGIYGMNFEHPESPWAMPELGWYYGYPLVWGLMILVGLGLLWIFRRRNWL